MDAQNSNAHRMAKAAELGVEYSDVKAVLESMFYACKRLKTARVSVEQIRANKHPDSFNTSAKELTRCLDAAAELGNVTKVGSEYEFPEKSEYASALNPPEDKRKFLGTGFNLKRAACSTRLYLGTADPRDHR